MKTNWNVSEDYVEMTLSIITVTLNSLPPRDSELKVVIL